MKDDEYIVSPCDGHLRLQYAISHSFTFWQGFIKATSDVTLAITDLALRDVLQHKTIL